MSQGQVACLECGRDVPADFVNAPEFLACPTCNSLLRIFAFPALHRAENGSAARPTIEAGEASCFYHPQKQAVVACDSCGRFLCALCDVEIGESHRCPGCLDSGKRKPSANSLGNRRVLYDSLALTLAIAPILIWPFTLFTAPTALYLVIRHWRQPLSGLPRTRIRFVVAFLIALAQVCGWAALIYFAVAPRHRVH